MNLVKFTINGQEVQRPEGTCILEAARSAGIYIPSLCYHPDLPTAKGSKAAKVIFQGDRRVENAMPEKSGGECGLCLVEIQGQRDLVGSCSTEIKEGMVVITENSLIRNRRQEKLIPILARHPHACLTCAQQVGCSRTQCSSSVPENEWYCPLLGIVNYRMWPIISGFLMLPRNGYLPISPYSEMIHSMKGTITSVSDAQDVSGYAVI